MKLCSLGGWGPPSRACENNVKTGAEINSSIEVDKKKIITITAAQEGIKLNISIIITVMLIKISPYTLEKLTQSILAWCLVGCSVYLHNFED